MSYIKINGEETHYNVKVLPFTTQHGFSAVRFLGDDIPLTDKGFKYYSDDDVMISDLSDYTYIYKKNEYAIAHDEIEYPVGSDEPVSPSAISMLSARLSQLSNVVSQNTNDITELDDALCEYSTDIDERVGELEDSFCEYTTDMDSRVGEVEDSLCELSEDTETEDEE